MKKFLSFLIMFSILFSLLLSASGDNTFSQEDFLADMAAGIKERLAYSKDHTDNDQETYLKLVEFELEHIEKYNAVSFEDNKFDALAHQYINACLMQKIGAENKRNENLFPLWAVGRTARSGLISYFYEMHNLDLTDEEIAEYRNSSSAASYSVPPSSSNSDDFKLYVGDISFVNASIDYSWGSTYRICYTLRNNSDYDLGILCMIEVFDGKGDVIGTISGFPKNENADGKILSGKIIEIEADLDMEDFPKAENVQLAHIEYFKDNGYFSINKYITLPESEIEKTNLSIN